MQDASHHHTRDGPQPRSRSEPSAAATERYAFPHEPSRVPRCCNHARLRLHAYRIVVRPVSSASPAGGKPTVLVDRRDDAGARSYTFDGFTLLSHEPIELSALPRLLIQGPAEQGATTTSGGGRSEYHAHLEPEVEDEFDLDRLLRGEGGGNDDGIDALDWFHTFFFGAVLQLDDFLDYTAAGGCRRFHLFPRFVSTEPPTRLMSAVGLRRCITESRVSALELIRSMSSRSGREEAISERLVDHILLVVDGTAFRADDVDFSESPAIRFNSPTKGRLSYRRHWDEELGVSVTDDQPLIHHYQTYTDSAPHITVRADSKRYRDKRNTQSAPAAVALDVHPPTGFHLRRGKWQKQPPEGHNATLIRLVPELCDWTPLTAHICHVGSLLPGVIHHIRFSASLSAFELILPAPFSDKELLKKAITHSSYAQFVNGGGVGHVLNTVASRVGRRRRRREEGAHRRCASPGAGAIAPREGEVHLPSVIQYSPIEHNQRLEYLGDAVLEFICSAHLFTQLPQHDEGPLSQYRSGLVNNRFLAYLTQRLHLDEQLCYADVAELTQGGKEGRRNMLADSFEALIGALYLDQGLEACREFFAGCLFSESEADLRRMWLQPCAHPLQEGPSDRHLIEASPIMKGYTKLEEQTGIEFKHIRLLVQAFTHSSLTDDCDTLKLGTSQRLEFLGDAVLQYVVTACLYAHYPDQNEGQLTQYRVALVNNQVLGRIGKDLGFGPFIRYLPSTKEQTGVTDSMIADCVEAFIGALFLEKGLEVVEAFVRVVFLPRLEDMLATRQYLDPKSRLSQRHRSAPPTYTLLSETGPAHMRKFVVGVTVRGRLKGKGSGYTRVSAEQNAANDALSRD